MGRFTISESISLIYAIWDIKHKKIPKLLIFWKTISHIKSDEKDCVKTPWKEKSGKINPAGEIHKLCAHLLSIKANMRQKSNRNNDSDKAAEELLAKLYAQARAQFGNAIKSYWFYDGDLCPACNRRPIGAIKIKGKNALSMNAFIYRPRGVLIGYLLCENCAAQIFKDAQKNPYTQTALHAEIERNLIGGYHAFLGKLDA